MRRRWTIELANRRSDGQNSNATMPAHGANSNQIKATSEPNQLTKNHPQSA
jgi:hypothetical protein